MQTFKSLFNLPWYEITLFDKYVSSFTDYMTQQDGLVSF